jgi:hypothetical protein
MHDEWEYLTAKIHGHGDQVMVNGLGQLGKDGWEAWAKDEHPDGVLVHCKRKKPAPMIMPAMPMIVGGKRS